MFIVRWVKQAPVLSEGDVNVYVGKRFQFSHHPHRGTPGSMEYSPLDMMFTPLELELLPLGCAPLETIQPLPGCAPLKVGREGEFLVAASEVGKNCAVFHVFQSSLCNCEVSSGWIAESLESIVQVRPIAVRSHGYM